MIKAILTDIEGTTSSLSFVKDVLFPYSRAHMADFIKSRAIEPLVAEQLKEVEQIAGSPLSVDAAVAMLIGWIDEDRKVSPLKAIQGLIWEHGYRNGAFKGHVYEDAVRNLRKWHGQGIRLYVFSSGSVNAQKLLFSHSEFGDLTPLFSGYFDTRTGAKQESSSYTEIIRQIGESPDSVMFLSDIEGELRAAAEAGLAVCHVLRGPESIQTAIPVCANTFDEVLVG